MQRPWGRLQVASVLEPQTDSQGWSTEAGTRERAPPAEGRAPGTGEGEVALPADGGGTRTPRTGFGDSWLVAVGKRSGL